MKIRGSCKQEHSDLIEGRGQSPLQSIYPSDVFNTVQHVFSASTAFWIT